MIHVVVMNGVPVAVSDDPLKAMKYSARMLKQSGAGAEYSVRNMDGVISDTVLPVITDELINDDQD